MVKDARWRLITYDGDTGRMLDYGRRTYRASTLLAGALAAAYQSSVGPGSTTPARESDLDHTVAFRRGGPTGYRNLAPLDRRWHGAKTHAGYRYTRDPATDRIAWSTPLGQTTTVDPYDWRLGP
jgi:hypothetical protein